jgi:WD40 repeat protein
VLYKAFLSYSHASDGKLALALQSGLHQFARPWYKLRAVRIFRDDTSLAANPALWSSIEDALKECEYFLLLASPDAARSPWVERELGWWLKNRSANKLLLLVTEGDVTWDKSSSDFDWSRTTALPSNLRRQFKEEPLYVDLRWAKTADNLSLRDSSFRSAVSSVAAPLHGKPKDGLDGEDVRQHRRFKIAVFMASTLLLILATVSVFAALNASKNAQVADAQRTIALARRLAAQSNLLREQPRALETRTLLAVESMRLVPGIDNDQALRESLYLLRKPVFTAKHGGQVTALAYTLDDFIATASGDGTVRVFNATTAKEVSRWIAQGRVVCLAFSKDGRLLATGSVENGTHLFDVASGKEVGHVAPYNGAYIVALSANGRWVATASNDGSAQVSEVASGREISQLRLRGRVSTFSFSPDDRWVAGGSDEATVRVFEVASGKEVSRLEHRGPIRTIAFSSNSHWVASGSNDGTTRVFETVGGRELPRPSPSGWKERIPSAGGEPFSVFSAVSALAFSPDNRLLATANDDSTARLFEIATGKEMARFAHDSAVETIAFSPDSRWMATGSLDASARIFETASGSEAAHLTLEGAVRAVVFDPGGRTLATVSENTLHVFEATDGRELVRLSQQNLLTTAVFSPDGLRIAVKSYDGQSMQILDTFGGGKIIRLPRRDLLAALTVGPVALDKFKPSGKRLLYSGEDEPAAFSPDGRQVAVGDDAGARVFEVASGKELSRTPENEVKAVSFSPDGRWVATANADGIAQLLEAGSGRVMANLTLKDGVSALIFSPDSRLVATESGDNIVHVFEVPSAKEVARLVHQSAVDAIAFSADSRLLATGGTDGTARVFQLATGKESLPPMKHPSGVVVVAFSPDGRWVATGSGKIARVFEVATNKEVARLEQQGAVKTLIFSSDSHWVATASYDYTARVFEAVTGRELSRINLSGRVKAMRFADGARVLQTASSGRLDSEAAVSNKSDFVSVQWHLLRPEDLIQQACSRLTRSLTEEEWKQYIGPELPYRKTCPNLP